MKRSEVKAESSVPNLHVFHSRTELTKERVSGERGTETDHPLLSCILEIPGIQVAEVTPYALAVMKAVAFKWTEIDPKVIDLIFSFNMGEGQLFETSVEVPIKEGEHMPANDLSSADLGQGFKLVFQHGKTKTDQVRAVVKDAEGKDFIVGPVVPEAEAHKSRMAVLMDPKNSAWLKGAGSVDPEEYDEEDVYSDPTEDDDLGDEEEED